MSLPDEQMVEAADAEILTWADSADPERVGSGRAVLTAAFAALDRDALIEAGAKALLHADQQFHGWDTTGLDAVVGPDAYKRRAEAVLRAVGLIA